MRLKYVSPNMRVYIVIYIFGYTSSVPSHQARTHKHAHTRKVAINMFMCLHAGEWAHVVVG